MRRSRDERAASNVALLIADFRTYINQFERSNTFGGLSLYFHQRAIERGRLHATAGSALADERLLEYIYAVLPAWGMHRMGPQAAKVVDFDAMAASFQAAGPLIEALWHQSITAIPAGEESFVAEEVWSVIASLEVSRSETHIVAGSKALHHVLPDLVPPVRRHDD